MTTFFMLIVLSIAPLLSLGEDNQNEVQHVFSGHVMLLALVLVLHNAKGIKCYHCIPYIKDN